MSEATQAITAATAPAGARRLWTRPFVLVCGSGFLAYACFSLLAPTIPLYIDKLTGSTAMVGLALASFSATSFILRPLIGRLADVWSARGVAGLGSLLLGVAGLAYLIPSVGVLFLGRALQGIGWGGVNVGGMTMVSNLAPAHRRSETAGYHGMAMMLASGFLPAVGLWLLAATSFSVVFVAASLAAALAAVLMLGFREEGREAPSPQLAAQEGGLLGSLVERSALLPATILMLLNLAGPATLFFVPLFAKASGIENVAIFFLVQGVVAILAQGGISRLADRTSRAPAIALGMLACVAGLLIISQASTLAVLTVGGAFFALGFRISTPALTAMVIDRSLPQRRGAAMATFSLSFQVGNAFGSLLGGFIIAWSGYPALYVISAVPLLAALGLLTLNWGAAATPAGAAEPASR